MAKAKTDAAKADGKRKSKKVKQGELPGMEKKHVKEVEDAGEAYETARDARMKLTEDESEKLTTLVEVMEKHRLTVYRNDEAVPPMLITLKVGKTRAKVERIKDGTPD